MFDIRFIIIVNFRNLVSYRVSKLKNAQCTCIFFPILSEILLPPNPPCLKMGQNPSRDRGASGGGGDPESGQSSRRESGALNFGAAETTPLPHILALANGGR